MDFSLESEERSKVDLVFQSANSLELRLPKVEKEVYQVNFKKLPDLQIVLHLEN